MNTNKAPATSTKENPMFLQKFEQMVNDKLRTDGVLFLADFQRMWADYVNNSKED